MQVEFRHHHKKRGLLLDLNFCHNHFVFYRLFKCEKGYWVELDYKQIPVEISLLETQLSSYNCTFGLLS